MIYAFDFDAECMAKKNGKVMNRNLAVVETVAVKECVDQLDQIPG